MVKKNISSVEVSALVSELQFLINGKVSQIYHLTKKDFLLQLHARGKGKQLLKIVSGKWLHITHTKETPMQPTGFCMQMRKYLSNASIKEISQKDSERIIVFTFVKEKTYYLIVELFSKGNVVFTDEKYNILGTLQLVRTALRSVLAKGVYTFPNPGFNWKKTTQKELGLVISTSEKRNLVTTLATECGLGGVYAQEICTKAEVDSQLKPAQVSAKDVQKLFTSLSDLQKALETPKGIVYEDDISPIPLQEKKPIKTVETYSELLDEIIIDAKPSPYDQKIEQTKKIIDKQEQFLVQIEENIEENTLKAEKVYDNYAPLKKLLSVVDELKKTLDWKEIKVELEKEKKIKSINLKKKTVVIDL